MRLASSLAVFVVGGVSCLPAAYAWAEAGHEIIATIAHMYLHPTVLPILCSILDLDKTHCHLAPISTWADENRYRMVWSAPLHFVGAIDDHPPNHCVYPGPSGWAGKTGINLLDGIQNVTGLLADWVHHTANHTTANEALKFLVHFLGEMHQPLHLTGRDKGGHLRKVLWNKYTTNLHSVWDTYLIAEAVRTVPRNYSSPLPSPAIEARLRGKPYDPYIRRIMWEGLFDKWADEIDDWLLCSTPIHESSVVEPEGQKVLSGLSSPSPRTLLKDQGVEINPDGSVVCPYFWSKPLNALNCDIIWPKPLALKESGGDQLTAHLELDTPEYAGVIEKRMLLEKLLAQGGIRLAGVLNYLFADQIGTRSTFVMNLKV